MAVEYKWVLYTNADYKRVKAKENKVVSVKSTKLPDIYFVDKLLKLQEWIVISEEWDFYNVRVKERISGIIKEEKIEKSEVRFERF